MVYLDYSATTPVNKDVLDTFIKVTNDYIGNPNSLHKLGLQSKQLIDASTKQIASILGVLEKEVIYTSGASESNNLAIKGVCSRYKNRGNHIITTKIEHSSVTAPIAYLQNNGFDVDFVDLDENGQIDINHLKSLIKDTTILVSITSINSEVGVIQPIEKIGKLLMEYPKIIFHSDMTQSIGKININIKNVDLISFSAQKIYGIKGIGCLIKKEGVNIDPIIHGGKSTTIFRSGTPAVALIASIAKTIRLAYEDIDNKLQYVKELKEFLVENLKKNKYIHINSNEYCSPYILNISIANIKPETMLHALEEDDIYISTQTACSSKSNLSTSVYQITKNEEYAKHSIRISLSYLTSLDELKYFVSIINRKIEELEKLYESH